MSVRVTGWLERNSGLTIVLSVIATILLVIPFLAMQPTETASGEPGGEVFDSLVTADQRFASQVYVISFIIEDPDGDLLRKDPLQELLTNEQAIRDDPEIGPKLFRIRRGLGGRRGRRVHDRRRCRCSLAIQGLSGDFGRE